MCPQEHKGYAVAFNAIFLVYDAQGLNGVALMFLRAHGRKSMPVCLEALMFLCSYVLRVSGPLRRQPLCFFGHADVSPWPAAQRPFVCLMKTYVAYVFRAKRLTQT